MAEAKNKFESIREWVVEHKLRTVGCLWLSGIAGSIAYNWSQPNMKTSVKIIHASLVNLVFGRISDDDTGLLGKTIFGLGALPITESQTAHFKPLELPRLHAQALTLAALAGAAVVEYYDHKSGAKARRVAGFLESESQGRKS